MSGKITVAIQAGGKSSRMGQDKSFVSFAGKPMIEHIRAKVDGLGDELILITNNPAPYKYLNLPLYADVFPDKGSLGGIYTAVYYASHPYTLVVACDMPWLNRPLLAHLLGLRQRADVIIPRWQQFPEPLHAVYHKRCLPAIAANIAAGKLKITRFFDQVSVHYVEREEIVRFDANGRSFANINTPEELAAAEKRDND